jgi:hypothetical protein
MQRISKEISGSGSDKSGTTCVGGVPDELGDADWWVYVGHADEYPDSLHLELQRPLGARSRLVSSVSVTSIVMAEADGSPSD